MTVAVEKADAHFTRKVFDMGVKFTCCVCGDTGNKERFFNPDTGETYFICTKCFTAFDDIVGEYIPVNSTPNCKYNIFVECDANNRLPNECKMCGWNPAVSERRKKCVLHNIKHPL